MKKIFTPATKKLILLIIGQILLKTTTFSAILTNCRRGMLLYFMSSMFAVFALLLIYFEVYRALIKSSFSELGASTIIFLLLILTAASLYSLAQYHIKKAKKMRNSSLFLKKQNINEKIELLVESFLDGLINDDKK